MSSEYSKIKPIQQLDDVLSTLDSLFDEFEKKNPEKTQVSCPFCNADESVKAFSYKNCDYRKCSNCESVYLSPRVTEEWLGEYYSFMQERFAFEMPESNRQSRIDNLMKPRWELLYNKFKPFIKSLPVKRYMEVGPGVGYFTEVAQMNNCADEYILIEPDVHCQEQLKKLGGNTKIYDCILENVDAAECGKVDIIFINSVIEHPFSINNFFAKLNELLSDNGIIVLVDMHCKGLDIEVLKENTPNVNVYSILQIASINGIETMCKNNGFEMKDVFSIGKMDIDIIYEYAKSLDDEHPLKGFENVFGGALVRQEIQDVLSKHLLTGYNGYIFQKSSNS